MRTWWITGLVVLAACSSAADEADVTTSAVTPPVVTTLPGVTTPTVTAPVQASVTTTVQAPVTTPAAQVATSQTTPPESAAPDAVTPDGFDSVAATITAADGTVCEVCLWLAATNDERAQGLMLVTDLGGRDGMAFVYDAPHSGAFWMKNTVMPLSIAFFDAEGAYLDAFDMEPCTADPCLRYPTPRNFTVAIETSQGNLVDLKIAAGSRLTLTALPCTP